MMKKKLRLLIILFMGVTFAAESFPSFPMTIYGNTSFDSGTVKVYDGLNEEIASYEISQPKNYGSENVFVLPLSLNSFEGSLSFKVVSNGHIYDITEIDDSQRGEGCPSKDAITFVSENCRYDLLYRYGTNTGGTPQGWYTSDGVCNTGDVVISQPTSGQNMKSENVELGWLLNGNDCNNTDFIISVFSGDSVYSDLGVIPASSGNYLYTGITDEYKITYFAISYTGEDGSRNIIAQSNQFVVDNQRPTIISSHYSFDPARTTIYSLNDKVNISFTGSELLTGITVTVLGRDATYVSKSGLRYNYSIQLSSNNSTGQFEYNISYQDLAGNTGYYELVDTGLVLDNTAPELSGSIEFAKTSEKVHISMSFTEESNVTFTYVLSGGKAGETLKSSATNEFSTNLTKARTDLEDKVYKYTVTIEDKVGNKKYYAGAFWFSGGNIEKTIAEVSGPSINNDSLLRILPTLRSEMTAYSGCKENINFKLITQTIRSGYTVKIEMPEYSDASLQESAEFLVEVLLGTNGLSKPTLSGFTASKVNSFTRDVDNYLVAVKLRRDPNTCNTQLYILPNLYAATLLKTLKLYGILK